jgi:hypothetical protein
MANPAWYGLAIGLSLWIFLFLATRASDRLYVLGHELTHALWGLLMGARVGKIRVSHNGGHVLLSKSNMWIALAPYFFPFYTWMVFAAYALVSLKWDPAPLRPVWFAMVGLTWGFHATYTLRFLGMRQPDVLEHGRLFSYTVIYLINIAGLSVWLTLAASPTFRELGSRAREDARAAYTWTAHASRRIATRAANEFRRRQDPDPRRRSEPPAAKVIQPGSVGEIEMNRRK